MQAQIETLVKLQAVDLERNRITAAARALPGEITLAAAEVAAAERKLTEASAAIKREEDLRTRLDKEIAAHRQKVARFRKQLDTLTTPDQAVAMEHEIRFADSEAERLENEAFASLEKTEALENTLTAARSEVEGLKAALEKTRSRVAGRQQEYEAAVARLTAERDLLRPAIEPELLMRYDRMSSSRGTGLARVENQQCTGCRMGVRPQTWNELREGRLLTCDSCGRLLYWDAAMEPAAPVPPEAAKSGAGRAVRKPRAAAPTPDSQPD
jgi:predicted  nucleic acid-binding Zn-ribbon protein